MRQRFSWKKFLLCAVLQFAALTGAPMRPKDIEDALRPTNEIAEEKVSRGDSESPPSGRPTDRRLIDRRKGVSEQTRLEEIDGER